MAIRIFFILSAWLFIIIGMSKMALPMCSNFSHILLIGGVDWKSDKTSAVALLLLAEPLTMSYVFENNLNMKILYIFVAKGPEVFCKHMKKNHIQ